MMGISGISPTIVALEPGYSYVCLHFLPSSLAGAYPTCSELAGFITRGQELLHFPLILMNRHNEKESATFKF